MTLKIRMLFAATALIATTANAQQNAPHIRHVVSGEEHWLFACIPDESVDHFLRAGFGFSGAPGGILCIDGYTAMYKQLGH